MAPAGARDGRTIAANQRGDLLNTQQRRRLSGRSHGQIEAGAKLVDPLPADTLLGRYPRGESKSVTFESRPA